MSELSVSLLGAFEVTQDGQPVTGFGYDKVRALLAYLITEAGPPHRRENLIGLLWPDDPEPRARQSLSQALSTLRTAIGDRTKRDPGVSRSDRRPFIEATRQMVRFDEKSAYRLDIDQVVAHLQAGDAHNHPALAGCDKCLDHLIQAVNLYRGDFLEDLMINDSATFEAWALMRREQLKHQILVALDRLTDAYLERSTPTEALTYARRHLALDRWREQAHRQAMQALALTGRRTEALAQFETCRKILASELQVEPEPATVALYTSIQGGSFQTTHAPLINGALPPAPGAPPFKGLHFFDVNDANLFFGRQTLTARLVRRVSGGERFLAIVGASGSGKSSLVRAGLVATLQHQTGQCVHVMTPTARPIENLCRNMTGDPASKTNLEMLSDKMRETPQALHHYVQQITGAETEVPFLIVVDQFEEIFTLCRDPEDRQAFLDNLLTAALLPGSAAAVIALRADFYHRCAEYEKLREALEAHQVYIGAMTPEELCQAIVAPAQHNAWSFEPGLVDLMLKDVGAGDHRGAEPGALPLLSHALLETWKRRQGRTLTLKGYTDAGGVRGAIARSAETVYDGLDPAQQHIARSIFLRLTEIGDADEEAGLAIYTRRRATRQEIEPASTGNDGVRTVLDTLARERLITMGHDTVEVAHEALIREWSTLRTWLEEDLEGLRIHRHLTEAAQAWANRGDDPGELYRGARLAQAKAWAETTDRQLSSLERDFLNAAAAEAARAEAAREAQRQRELKAAQDLAHAQQRRAEERGRLLRWLGLIAGLLLIAAIAAASLGQSYRRASQESAAMADAKATVAAENAAVAATAQAAEAQADAALKREAQQHAAAGEAEREAADQRDAAQAQARINLANSLAGQATIHEEKNSELALLLALEANAMRDAPQTRGALMSALEHSPGHIEYLTDNAGSVQALAVSPDGAVLASAGGNNVHLWETETGRPIGEPLTDVGDDVRDLVFIDDRTLVILARTYDEHPSVLLAPASQATGIGKPSMILTSTRFSGGIESYMAINPDGRSLAIAGCGATFAVPPGGVFCDRGGGATVWDITGSQNGDGVSHEVVSLEITGEIYDVAYSPDGDRIALVGCTSYRDNTCEQGFSMLWQPETGETFMLDQGTVNNAPMALINAVAFTPDGAHLAVGGCSAYDATGVCQEGRAELWDLIETAQIAAFTIEGENGCQSLAVSPGGQTLALGSSDTIRLWKPLMQELDGLPMIGHTGHVMALAFKPDDRALFSGGQDRKIGVWDLALRGGIGSRLTSQLIPALHVAYAPDGALIAAGTPGGVNLWDAATGDLAYRLALSDPSAIVWDVDFSPDGQTLAAAGLTDSKIRLWDLATRARLGQPVKFAPGGGAYSVAFSPDGKTLAASGEGAEITLWDVNSLINSAPVSRTLTGHEHGGNPQVTFSPDGALLASAGHDNTVRLWDVATGEQRGETMTAHEDNVLTVAFSPDGRILASGGQDTTIRLWDVATQARIAELYGHDQFVWRLAFTPDGDTLVSFDAWGILRLWDMRDPTKPGQPIGETQPGHKAWAWGLALSPDGAQAITSARSGELQRWQIDLAWWRERACDIASRNLTLEEWENYLPGEPYRKTCR